MRLHRSISLAGAVLATGLALPPVAQAAPAVPAVQQEQTTTGGSDSDVAADCMLIAAGVGGWATFSLWAATRHRRRLSAAFGRAAAAVGDEAEAWLREQ